VPVVAITGASGFVGSALARRFAASGWDVVALVRNPRATRSDVVRAVPYDLQGGPPPGALAGVDCLVHTAYVKGDLAVNVEGTRRLVDAARADGASSAVFVSSMSAGSPSIYGQQKQLTETLFDGPHDAVIRPGLVIGDGGLLGETVRFMRRWRIVPLVDGGQQPMQTIGVEDLASAIQTVVEHRLAGVWTIADPRPVTYAHVYRAIAAALGLRVLFVPIPFAALLAAVRGARLLRLPLGLSEDNLRGLRASRYVDSTADLERLGLEVEPLEHRLMRALA